MSDTVLTVACIVGGVRLLVMITAIVVMNWLRERGPPTRMGVREASPRAHRRVETAAAGGLAAGNWWQPGCGGAMLMAVAAAVVRGSGCGGGCGGG